MAKTTIDFQALYCPHCREVTMHIARGYYFGGRDWRCTRCLLSVAAERDDNAPDAAGEDT